LKLKQKHWIILGISYTTVIFIILILAYTGHIPTEIAAIPAYDKIGHFTLYGIWSYLAWLATNRFMKFKIPMGPAIITIFTIAEEFLQAFSSNRTSSLADLFFSLTGVWLAILLDLHFHRKSITKNKS